MIELLVVVAIIALLIAILLPSLAAAREQSRRVVCAATVREHVRIALTEAVADKGKLPDWHNDSRRWGTAFWYRQLPYPIVFDLNARDYLLKKYGVTRDMFYCPSNHDEWWNRDDFWAGLTYSTWGYAYFAAASIGHNPTNGFPNWTYRVAGIVESPFADRLVDRPPYDIVWSDVNRQVNTYGWFRVDKARGSNHFDDETGNPVGTNNGYLDGHVEWVNFAQMHPEMSLLIYTTYWW